MGEETTHDNISKSRITIKDYILDSIDWATKQTQSNLSEEDYNSLDEIVLEIEDKDLEVIDLTLERLNNLIATYEKIENYDLSISMIFRICLRLLKNDELNLEDRYKPNSFTIYELVEDEWNDFSTEEGKLLYWGKYFGQYNKKQYLIMKFENVSFLKDYFTCGNQKEVIMEQEAYLWLIDLLKRNNEFDNKIYLCTNLLDNDKCDKKNKIIASIKLSLLSAGQVFHSIREYTEKPLERISQGGKKSCFEMFKPDNRPYEQMDQLFNVLNEYNGSRGVIEKYLKLYQVFEELMIRIDVVLFSNKGSIKTTRDFKNFKEVLGKSEKDSLNSLIQKLFLSDCQNDDSTNRDLIKEIGLLWDACDSEFKDLVEKEFRESEKTKKDYSNFSLDSCFKDINDSMNIKNNSKDLASFLSLSVYKLRNRIVHNKATENHITYVSLKGDIGENLENFFIPTLELLAFTAIIKFPDFLRYNNRELTINLY